jgi:hypothetical protein
MPTEQQLRARALVSRLTPAAEAFRKADIALYRLAAEQHPSEVPYDRDAALADFAKSLDALEKAAEGLGVRELITLLIFGRKLA